MPGAKLHHIDRPIGISTPAPPNLERSHATEIHRIELRFGCRFLCPRPGALICPAARKERVIGVARRAGAVEECWTYLVERCTLRPASHEVRVGQEATADGDCVC